MRQSSPINYSDIQGMLNSGYGWLTDSRFWLLTIRVRASGSCPEMALPVREPRLDYQLPKHVNSRKDRAVREAMAVAFSFSGL